jgi:hypothetical protein
MIMAMLGEVIPILKKILAAIRKDRTLLCREMYPKTAGIDNDRITVENLADLAGNHLFDDLPDLFGITKLEGHMARAYFQTGAMQGNYGYVAELHREFPEVMEEEREEYLVWVNSSRAKKGLPSIMVE